MSASLIEWYPRVVLANSETAVHVLPDASWPDALAESGLRVRRYCMDSGSAGIGNGDEIAVETAGDTSLIVRCSFPGEQEHILVFEAASGDQRVVVAEVRVYSVGRDLFELVPYKGDFHIHSNRSDGKDAPAYVAGACRRIGMDFMALTDHRQYAPSLEAIAAFAGMPVDLRMFPGEEVHPPDNDKTHMVNFGGRFSVNELFKGPDYRAEVREIEAAAPPSFNARERYLCASCLWTLRKIREAGGLAIFCHPYWVHERAYCVPESLNAWVFEHMPFDALELIGGFHRREAEWNMLQALRYHEERARGRHIPIVGVSDAHGCETGSLFGWYYTVVFARSPELPDVIEAVKAELSVAIEAISGETPRVHGPFRLAKYTAFLLREVFPAHDAFCREEGELMLASVVGGRDIAEELGRCQGRCARLMKRVFAGDL